MVQFDGVVPPPTKRRMATQRVKSSSSFTVETIAVEETSSLTNDEEDSANGSNPAEHESLATTTIEEESNKLEQSKESRTSVGLEFEKESADDLTSTGISEQIQQANIDVPSSSAVQQSHLITTRQRSILKPSDTEIPIQNKGWKNLPKLAHTSSSTRSSTCAASTLSSREQQQAILSSIDPLLRSVGGGQSGRFVRDAGIVGLGLPRNGKHGSRCVRSDARETSQSPSNDDELLQSTQSVVVPNRASDKEILHAEKEANKIHNQRSVRALHASRGQSRRRLHFGHSQNQATF